MTAQHHIGKGACGLVMASLLSLFLFRGGIQPVYAENEVALEDSRTLVERAIEHLIADVEDTINLYAAGRPEEALTKIEGAFFSWESSSADRRLRSLDLDLYNRLEGNLLDLRGMIQQGLPPTRVHNKAQQVFEDIEAVQARILGSVDEGSAVLGFFESLVLILREGFEAILVIAAVLAYLSRTGHADRARYVYQGTAAGIVASLVTAMALQTLFSAGTVEQELLEGITALLAVAVLFYVSHWLIGKIQHQRWENYLRGKVQTALSTARGWVLGSVAFLAIYREGFETVLFYQALSGFYSDQFWALVAGFGVGIIVLAILYGGFHLFQARIPLRFFFLITSLILYYLAFSFAGKGVRALQEAGVIGVTPVEGVPTLSLIGIFPTIETLLVQLLLVTLLLLGLMYTFILEPRKQQEKKSMSQG